MTASTALRVLVVDDSPDSLLTLQVLLEDEGHVVLILKDPTKALKAVSDFQPGVVLLDIHMPNMDGYEVAREIRATCGANPVLIAVTGSVPNAADGYTQALHSGFNHFITKPYVPATLLNLVKRAAH